MSSKEKANLARIRDNQRRSRARRKEYLQELEARLRQCELQGIEASSEIQLAARQVAEENKKLRGLLAQHGVGDDTIDHHLQTSPSGESNMAGQYGSSSAAVQVLGQLLQTRKSCCGDGTTPATPANVGERDSSSSTGTVQSPWDPIFTQNQAQGRRRSGTTGKQASSAPQFMTPSASNASRTSSVISGQTSNNHGMPSHQHQNQHLAPIQIPRNPARHSIPSSRNQQMFDFVDSQISMAGHPSYQAQKHLQPQQNHGGGQRSSVYIPTTSSSNANNCSYATDMITTMAGGDPNVVRADLGCYPGVEQCEVDNQLVFQVMDRYTGSVGL